MDEVPQSELWRDPSAFDAAVAATPGVDRYCSSSAWVLPAHDAFHADARPLILRSDAGWAALGSSVSPNVGRYLAPLEAMWGLACPLVGPAPARLARAFGDAAMARRASWDTLWLSGVPVDGPLFKALASVFARARCRVGVGPTAHRYVASLEGGFDGWLGRRSARFRANLRRALRRAEAEGVRFEPLSPRGVGPAGGADAAALYARILAIEARSWKGLSEVGITTGAMRAFYAAALERLVPRGGLRGVIASRDGVDVGFVFGGVFGDTYRGLQVSFDERQRDLSLGNVMQATMIARLCDEGVAVYDLGSEIAYKARWGELGIPTVALVVFNR